MRRVFLRLWEINILSKNIIVCCKKVLNSWFPRPILAWPLLAPGPELPKCLFCPRRWKEPNQTKPFLVCLGISHKLGIVSQTLLFSIDISPMFDPALWEKIQNCPQILSLTGKIIRNDEQSSYRETYFLWTSNTRQLCHMRSIIHHSDTGIWKRSNKQHHLVMFAISLLLVSLVAYSSPKITVPWKMGMKEFTKCVAPGKLYASVVGQGWYQNRNKFTNVSELI